MEHSGEMACADAISQQIKATREEILKKARYEDYDSVDQDGHVQFSEHSMVDMRALAVNA